MTPKTRGIPAPLKNPTVDVVRKSWNALSRIYRPPGRVADCFGHDEREYLEWLSRLSGSLSPGSKVLDLGCGTGVPAARFLSEKFQVTGVDLSDTMIRRARRLVPKGTFIRGDMTEVNLPEREYAAIIALYSIIHVPLTAQRKLFGRIHGWLSPRGRFLAVLGHAACEGWERGWLGSDVPMYWIHADAGTYRGWLSSAGFDVIEQRFVPEGGGGHELFLARARSERG